ncbi:helix-turn-helix domain-containing protein [Bacillus altitudinis]|uniref:helix-turn-helix domain-containing protein n=1 Tax=Bacillus altitudinis TaxID=293387 RepID=UPI0013EE46B2|nr:helix-turn-helix domain-containing protein [Bacillus altitudinis]QII25937.1 helix-turn-helix domain-containing protein [Bacillus altitudinis]
MSFINFNGKVKKMNHKPKGITELVLEVPTKELGNRIQNLAEMIDKDVKVEIESDIVRYNVQINANTERPIVNYEVDQSGVVHIAKPESEQLEAELGLPEEKPKIEEKPMEIKREVVDQFIIEGMAPEQEGFPDNMADIVKRRIEGESYSKLATELEMSSGTVVDLINDYRAAVAPLAEKWWDWKEDQANEAEPLQKENAEEAAEDEKGSDDSVSDEYDLPKDDQKNEEDGAA